jgi:hypothetical protein
MEVYFSTLKMEAAGPLEALVRPNVLLDYIASRPRRQQSSKDIQLNIRRHRIREAITSHN